MTIKLVKLENVSGNYILKDYNTYLYPASFNSNGIIIQNILFVGIHKIVHNSRLLWVLSAYSDKWNYKIYTDLEEFFTSTQICATMSVDSKKCIVDFLESIIDNNA